MTSLLRWKSGAATLMTIFITTGSIIPVVANRPANAQSIFNGRRSGNISISAGAVIPVTYEKEKVVVTPDETTPLTLKVARNIIDSNGNILIPEGAEITGELRPAKTFDSEKGTQFIAEELVLPNGDRQFINASSEVVDRVETLKKGSNTSKVLKDAAIGAGAASVIALLTGNRKIDILEPIAGGAAGALASVLIRGGKKTEVVVVRPEKDLDITLRSDLVVSLSR
ncbi:MAG: conjugal transfer protein TrbI [Mastigocoleus sp.]